jgi:hypothetical protein
VVLGIAVGLGMRPSGGSSGTYSDDGGWSLSDAAPEPDAEDAASREDDRDGTRGLGLSGRAEVHARGSGLPDLTDPHASYDHMHDSRGNTVDFGEIEPPRSGFMSGSSDRKVWSPAGRLLGTIEERRYLSGGTYRVFVDAESGQETEIDDG